MARNFDGTDDYISFGDLNIDPTSPMSMGAWMYTNNTADTPADSARERIISRANGTGTSYYFCLHGTHPQFVRKGNSPTGGPLTITVSTWIFVAVRCQTNGANTDLNYLMYSLNGTLTTGNVQDNFNTYTGGANSTWIGRDRGGGAQDEEWDGKLAHVGVWLNDYVTDAEMKAYAFLGIRAIGRTPDMYVPIYGTASSEPELGGRGFNGTVSGTTYSDHPPIGPYAIL
jgi:hypothetical protein